MKKEVKFLKETKKRKSNGTIVSLFMCFCGNKFECTKTRIKIGKTKSCGCLKFSNIEGKRFGKLIAVRRSKERVDKWVCKCDCGNTKDILTRSLNSGNTKSCGCLLRLTGKDHPHWNKNIDENHRIYKRSYDEYYIFRKKVHIRDKYECKICGYKGKKIVVHHLDSYHKNKDLRLKVNNAVVLCADCHDQFHCEYGQKNNTKEQFFEFYWGEINDNYRY